MVALALVACEPESELPSVPARDAMIPQRDSGPRITPVDSGIDAGPGADAGLDDGGTGADADAVDAGDAGERAPVVDGTIATGEWAGALEVTADVAPIAPFEGDRLTRLLAIRTPSRLYLAIEGTIEPGHSIVLYLDASFGAAEGVLLSSGNELADTVGALDRALSAPLVSMLSELRPDYAWGTTAMPTALPGSSDTGGWRDIAASQTDFVTLATGNRTYCTETACETSIEIAPSGIAGAGTIAVFARIVDGTHTLSSQTLPEDDAIMPELVGQVLLVD